MSMQQEHRTVISDSQSQRHQLVVVSDEMANGGITDVAVLEGVTEVSRMVHEFVFIKQSCI